MNIHRVYKRVSVCSSVVCILANSCDVTGSSHVLSQPPSFSSIKVDEDEEDDSSVEMVDIVFKTTSNDNYIIDTLVDTKEKKSKHLYMSAYFLNKVSSP